MTVTTKRPAKTFTIVDAVKDPDVFGSLPEFASLETWKAWLVWLKAAFAIPMDQDELITYRECTGRTEPPATQPNEVYSIIGRRGGKSYVSALVACFLAGFENYQKYLHTGEKAAILILARDRDQSKIVFGYINGILQAVPALRAKILATRSDEIELEGGILVLVKTSDYRAVRGLTVACCITDEISFWDSQGISPDREVLTALRPSMATIPGAKLLVISTPYAKVGSLFDAYQEHYGRDSDRVLVWQSDTRTMNPLITDEFIQDAIDRDPDGAQSEWLATFREDREAAFSIESLEACVIAGRGQLPSSPLIPYQAFCDPSGGRGDSFTLAIGHAQAGTVIVDLLASWRPPFDPDAVTVEVSERLRNYGCSSVVGDRYAGEWPISRFRANGIAYEQCEKPKSELYLSFIPTVNAKAVELPDDRQLINELRRLERRRGRLGKDIVDHRPGLFDDLGNAVAGLANLLTGVDASHPQSGFNRAKHVSDHRLAPSGYGQVGIGLTLAGPVWASVVGQLNDNGGISVYAAFASQSGLKHHIKEHLRPWLVANVNGVNGSRLLCTYEDGLVSDTQWSLVVVVEEALSGIPCDLQVAEVPLEARHEALFAELSKVRSYTLEPVFQVDPRAELIPPSLSRPYDPRGKTIYDAVQNALGLLVSRLAPISKPEPAKPIVVNQSFNALDRRTWAARANRR